MINTLKAGEGYQTVEKALRVLELLAVDAPLGVTDISQRLQMEKSCTSRLLKTLAGLGYVSQLRNRGPYWLGPWVHFLGKHYLENDHFIAASKEILSELAENSRASAHIAACAGFQMIVLSKKQSPERIQVASSVGEAVVPHASALGKVLLTGMDAEERLKYLRLPLKRFTESTVTDMDELTVLLDEVRRCGYAIEDGEEHLGVGCISAPIRNTGGAWVGALSISGPVQGTPFGLNDEYVELLVTKADELSRRMGFRGDGLGEIKGI